MGALAGAAQVVSDDNPKKQKAASAAAGVPKKQKVASAAAGVAAGVGGSLLGLVAAPVVGGITACLTHLVMKGGVYKSPQTSDEESAEEN